MRLSSFYRNFWQDFLPSPYLKLIYFYENSAIELLGLKRLVFTFAKHSMKNMRKLYQSTCILPFPVPAFNHLLKTLNTTMKNFSGSLLLSFFVCLFLSENGQAQVNIDSLRQVVASASGVEKLTKLSSLSFYLCKAKTTAEEGREIAEQTIPLVKSLSDSEEKKLMLLYDLFESVARGSIRLGEFGRAQEAVNQAIGFARDIPGAKKSQRLGRAFMQSAEIYYWQGQYEKQIAMLRKAIDIFESCMDCKNDWAVSMNLLGSAYAQKSNLDSALYCFQTSDPIFESWGKGYGLPNKTSIIKILQLKNRWEEADPIIEFLLANQSPDMPEISYTYMAKGDSYLHQKKYVEALSYYRKSLPLIHKISEPQTKAEIYEQFSIVFEEMGQLDSALEYLKLYQSYEDSLELEQFGEQIVEAQTRLETKERLLSLEQQLQSSANRKLALVVGALLLLGFIIGWFFYQKNKRDVAAASKTVLFAWAEQPNDQQGTETAEVIDPFIKSFLAALEERLDDENLNVDSLADQFKMSRVLLYQKIKAATGASPSEILRQYRLETAKRLLQKSDLTISEIAYRVGFSNPNSFTRAFKGKFGRPPSGFINQN